MLKSARASGHLRNLKGSSFVKILSVNLTLQWLTILRPIVMLIGFLTRHSRLQYFTPLSCTMKAKVSFLFTEFVFGDFVAVLGSSRQCKKLVQLSAGSSSFSFLAAISRVLKN